MGTSVDPGVDDRLSLGDLTGNRFYINTSRLTEEPRVRELNDEMNLLGGFPNFFRIPEIWFKEAHHPPCREGDS